MKKIFYPFLLSMILLLVFCPTLTAMPIDILEAKFPHWDFAKPINLEIAKAIDNFAEKNADKNNIAAFDWDGTLYNEHILAKNFKNDTLKTSSQGAWYLWTGCVNKDQSNYFPAYLTDNGRNYKKNIISRCEYLFGMKNVSSSGYNFFIQSAAMVTGMSVNNFNNSVQDFIKDNLPIDKANNNADAFLSMLDVVQLFVDYGYNVWIITGSNPAYVANFIDWIEKNIKGPNGQNYNFNISTLPYSYKTGHISGNSTIVDCNNIYSALYDDSYMQNPAGNLYICDHEGKVIALNNITEKTKSEKFVFYAGNSDGDYNILKLLTEKPYNTLGILVNPKPTSNVKKLADKYPFSKYQATQKGIIELKSTQINQKINP